MFIVLIIVLLVLMFAGLPGYGYPHNYGYYPSGIGGILLIILIVWLIMGGRF